MRLYTKTGDLGETGLFGGARVGKDTLRVEAYGTIDELNAVLGLARAQQPSEGAAQLLSELQQDLFVLGAELACVPSKRAQLKMRLLDASDIARLEQQIDTLSDATPALRTFVLPGGHPAAAALHLARTVARRGERLTLSLSREEEVRSEVLIYLNRLSDLLFALARSENHRHSVSDIPWLPRA